MPRDLAAWLRLLEARHPRAIRLGLDRTLRVRDRLGWRRLPFAVLTVAGTNGKGSAVAMLEAILLAAGYRTGAYTSPHLRRYNERVRLDGAEADDAMLCAAFERVEAARGRTPLTYFETGTLGAMGVFLEAAPDVVILEVGLGGRLDAVNAFDADGALLTSVDLDHRDWLGDDRAVIGREKAGVFRAGRPAVCAARDAPASVAEVAREVGAALVLAGRDYRWSVTGDQWRWESGQTVHADLPLPALAGEHQVGNAAGVLALLAAVEDTLPVAGAALRSGLAACRLEGRLERRAGPVEWLYDVAHNAEAARALAAHLRRFPVTGRSHALFAMLRDKDVEAAVGALRGCFDSWWVPGLDTPRASSADALAATVARVCPGVRVAAFPDTARALAALHGELRDGDRVTVCGSFFTVAEARRLESSRASPETAPHG